MRSPGVDLGAEAKRLSRARGERLGDPFRLTVIDFADFSPEYVYDNKSQEAQ